ncbi:RNA recognition motif, partial [Trifolium medium]|nr:RNA recognition motif [Trifolium medium]
YGSVTDVFIPKKVDKWGRRFGFVKFKEVKEVDALSDRLEDVWWGNFKLRINLARFRKGEKKENSSAPYQPRRSSTANDLQVSDARSFKSLLVGENGDKGDHEVIEAKYGGFLQEVYGFPNVPGEACDGGSA